MNLKVILIALVACACWAADPVAARLAREAHKAQEAGQLVRAYLLYAEAAARDPQNPTYRANRDSLASTANLLTKADVQTADVSADIKAAESARDTAEPPIELGSKSDWAHDIDLQPVPKLQASASLASFDTRGDEKSLFQQVAGTYGIRPIIDDQLEPQSGIRFSISNVDFHTAMEALTAVTNTFMFPISQHDIYVARNTVQKRLDLEPHVLLSFPLPNALTQNDLVEAANAVRQTIHVHAIGWDSANRIVMIRDRASRARIAESLLEAILLPHAQVSLEIQFLTMDSDRSYHYGTSLQTAFQLFDLGHLGGFQTILPALSSAMNYLSFGGGATLFGFGLADATIFATYSKSFSKNLYDTTFVVADGQTAEVHIGDKWPIPQTLYTGFSQSASSIYNPIGQVTLEDLGVLLKVTPRITGEGGVGLDLEADFKALGTQTIDSVPEVSERQFKGNITLREGEWAVLAGLDENTQSLSTNGLAGISQIPGLNQVLSEKTRDTRASKTLIVLKPTITRLPMSWYISPQFSLGPELGDRVVI